MGTKQTNRGWVVALLLGTSLGLAACGDDDAGASDEHDGGGSGSTGSHAGSGSDSDSGAVSGSGADASIDMGGEPAGGGTCDMGESCDFSCTEGCMVECLGGTCNAECPEGSCTLDSDFEAVTHYTCEGGGCEFDCDGASDCTIDCEGGGCLVACDGDSRCKVSCGEAGEPCQVGCEAGALASCDNDHCEITGCEVCDESMRDESYMPSLDAADYSAEITNPYFPLPVGGKWVYEGPGEVITVEVLDETYTTQSGVEARVVRDTVTTPDGELIEDTNDWYAQDGDGNVWYFGEDTAEYVNGVKANTRGSWEAGVDGALPGIIMHGTTPEIGTEYRQEYYRCEAEDNGQILATGETVTVPTGTYEDCIRIRDFALLDPNSNEHKLFCPDVGLVLVEDAEVGAESGEPVETLVSVELP